MWRASAAALVMLLLAGCNPFESQVDKCVSAYVRANEPYQSEKDRGMAEHGARIRCMRAASGER